MSQLRFRSIAISNFKTFAGDHKFDLERKPGLYYITGANKLDPELGANGVGKSTIWDALTWVLWGRTGRDNRPADAVKPWVGKGQTCVELHFERNGESVVLKRERSPNRLAAMTSRDQEGGDIAQDEVPKLLGMSEEMFRRTLVLGQFGTLFLDLKPEAQAQMFTEALSLDVWLRAIEAASNAAKAAQRAADQAVSDQQVNNALLATTSTNIEEYTTKSVVFEEDKAQRLRKGAAGIESLEADLNAAQAKPVDQPTMPGRKALDALKAEREPLKQNIAVLLRDVQRSQTEHNALVVQIKELQKPKAKATCRECGQPLTDKGAADLLAKLKVRAVAEDEVIDGQEAEAAKLQKQVDKLNQKIATAHEEYDTAAASFHKRMLAWSAWTRNVAAIKGELGRWRDQLQQVHGETNQAAASVTRLKQRRTELRSKGTELQAAHEAALVDVEHAKFWVDGFREIRLSVIDQTLVELEMASSRHMAMLGLNDWGIKFDTERETKSGTVSYAFSVLLYPPGKDEPVKWESYSGGEAQRVQLAVAFGLSEVLLARAGIAPNIEVLDEPTRGLSAGGVGDLLEHLRDRARELGRAIYFVDHHSLDKGAFDATLLVTKTKKGSTFAWQ